MCLELETVVALQLEKSLPQTPSIAAQYTLNVKHRMFNDDTLNISMMVSLIYSLALKG
jgi:hypothetical protein